MIAYFQTLLDILFPPACFSCGATLEGTGEKLLCPVCRGAIQQNTAFTCPICRGRLPLGPSCLPAGRCHKNTDYILLSASTYSNKTLRTLIWQLKFRRRASVASELAKLLYEILSVARVPTEKFICVPIPLHPRRLRARGFNQTELIAQELGRLGGGISIETTALIKSRHTIPQTVMKDREMRKENLKGCFEVIHPEAIIGRNILLIDDVWTSGTTMNEAARALKLAGAKSIIGLVVAKAG